MTKTTDIITWLLLVSGVVLTIGLAIAGMSDMPAELRSRLLLGYFVVACMFGYAAYSLLDVMLTSSAGADDESDAKKLAMTVSLKRTIGLFTGVLAFMLLVWLRRS